MLGKLVELTSPAVKKLFNYNRLPTSDKHPNDHTPALSHSLSRAMYLGTTDGPSCIDIIAIAKAPN